MTTPRQRAPGAGRPPRDSDGLAEQRVTVRLTAAGYARVIRAAEASGERVAAYIARVAVEASPSTAEDPDELRAALATYREG